VQISSAVLTASFPAISEHKAQVLWWMFRAYASCGVLGGPTRPVDAQREVVGGVDEVRWVRFGAVAVWV